MALETPQYEVTSEHDGFEVRCYSEMIIATTSVRSDYRGSTSSGFRRIANYIFGGNDKEMKIAMTAPVKYAVGNCTTAAEAKVLKMQLQKQGFSDAFVVKFEGTSFESQGVKPILKN